jgi:hypothetical protein
MAVGIEPSPEIEGRIINRAIDIMNDRELSGFSSSRLSSSNKDGHATFSAVAVIPMLPHPWHLHAECITS